MENVQAPEQKDTQNAGTIPGFETSNAFGESSGGGNSGGGGADVMSFD